MMQLKYAFTWRNMDIRLHGAIWICIYIGQYGYAFTLSNKDTRLHGVTMIHMLLKEG